MTFYADNMPHQATYWPAGQNDGEGGIAFGSTAPVLLACRWQNTKKLMRDAEGREFVSEAVVYLPQDVELLGQLALGDYTSVLDPAEVDGAYEIRIVNKTSSLDGQSDLVKAVL